MTRSALFLSLCLAVTASGQSLTPTVIVRTGQSVDDVPGATFTTIGSLPRLGANGHVAFNSFITGGGSNSSNNFGYWVGTPSGVNVALRSDTAAPNGPTTFSSSGNAGVDANGRISMWASINTTSSFDQRLWGLLPDGNGGSTIVASEGVTAAPGFAGGLFAAVGAGQSTNSAGVVTFTGSVSGGDSTADTNFGLFVGTPGDLKLIARKGMAAPGATGTAPIFSTTTGPIFDKRINAAGQVGFAAALAGDGVNFNNDRAIYVWTPNAGGGTFAVAAQTGNVAPGTTATTKFTVLDDQPGFSDAGHVAFRSGLVSEVPGEVGLLNNSGIWAGTPGNIQLVARGNDPSPIAGTTFRVPDFAPRVNDSGQVAFFSLVVGTGADSTNDEVLWLKSSSGIEIVAREASPAPGTTVNFGPLDSIVAINNAGQVAFSAPLAGAGVGSSNDRGLWAGAPGSLSLVAREGDVIDVDPGVGEVLKTISGTAGISWASGFASPVTDSGSAAFNDAGQIAWQATFTDGTRAVLLTTLPSSPVGLDGDYNNNGSVDAADYVLWRNGGPLMNEVDDPGTVNAQDYTEWRARFGNAGSGSSHSVPGAEVPEPAAWWLILVTYVLALFAGRIPYQYTYR
jgi:hypothetical protein